MTCEVKVFFFYFIVLNAVTLTALPKMGMVCLHLGLTFSLQPKCSHAAGDGDNLNIMKLSGQIRHF